MNQKRIGLVHATLNAVQPMNDALRELVPGMKVLNFLDEGLIEALNQQGVVTPDLLRRLVELIGKAEQSGVDGILLTCSSFSAHVPELEGLFQVPVVSADYAMLEKAVMTGHRIGVIATVPAAGPITEKQLNDLADQLHRTTEVCTVIVPEAFQALQAGDAVRHDELIQEKMNEMAISCDLIVLAQISMARALAAYNRPEVRVLTSPEISIQTLLSRL